MSDNEREREIVRDTIRIPSPLQKYQPGVVRREQHDGLSLERLANGDVDDNFAFVYGPIEVERVMYLANQFFGEEAYAVTVESDTNDNLENWLTAQDWLVYENEPQMTLSPIPTIETQESELRIVVAENQQQYEDFLRTSETGRRWVPSLEAATDPEVALLVGYVDDVPVATSRVSCLGQIANVHGVVTEPSYRRRGFGTQMTWAAIDAGKSRGCTSIVLSASEMGLPVYERIGFRTVCRYCIYVPPGTPV